MTARILVVDDEPAIRRLVIRAAERAGYTVAEAETAAEALTLESIQERLEAGSDEGRLTGPELAKADSLVARLGAVKKGTYDLEAWVREVQDATPAVQALFAVTPVQAAA